MTSTYKQEFLAALDVLAQVFTRYEEISGRKPILVGGAAASIYTGGRIESGDFDVVEASDDLWGQVLSEFGWESECRPGYQLIGWFHRDIPNIGIQLVSGSLFEGKTDRSRIALVPIGESGSLALPPIEDLIADRLGQYCSTPRPVHHDMLEQARLLFRLAIELDRDYLLKRIVEEQGDVTLLDVGDEHAHSSGNQPSLG